MKDGLYQVTMNTPNRPIPEDGTVIWNIQKDITAYESMMISAASRCPYSTALLPPECKRHLSLPPLEWEPPRIRWWYDASRKCGIYRLRSLQWTRRLHPELEYRNPTFLDALKKKLEQEGPNE